MRYRYLPWLLQQEGTDFQRIEQRWRPVDILYIQQTRALLHDLRERYEQLAVAQAELQTLTKADLLIKLLTRMRMYVRQAGLFWKTDHLSFIRAVAGFYADLGVIMRTLKNEQDLGRFVDSAPTPPTPSERVVPRPDPKERLQKPAHPKTS